MKTAGRQKSRFLRIVLYAGAVWLIFSVLAAAALRFVDPAITAVMIFEPGSVAEIERRWVSREQMSRHLVRAAIAAEDQRFLEHSGLDFDQIGDAFGDWRRGGELRGASTITQQVAKNVFLWNGRSFVRKALEAWLAVVIDALVPKDRILELYLNVAEFGQHLFGVEAASRHFFGSSAAALTPAQAAALIAVLPAPKRYTAAPPSDYVVERVPQIMHQVSLLEQRGHYRTLVW